MEVHLVVLVVVARSSDSRQTAVLHTHQKKGGGGAVTGSEGRVMNCQLRLGLTRLYMTGQIHSRLPGREGGGDRGSIEGGRRADRGMLAGENKTQIYGLPVFGPGHMSSVKRGN